MAARSFLKKYDTSRPVQYEGGGAPIMGFGQSRLTDIICPMCVLSLINRSLESFDQTKS